jgi:two-component system, chemotaxis family, CheB/CheR fusion protein
MELGMSTSAALRVLVADDNRDCADSLIALLEIWGYETVVAYDGEAALAAALATKPDILLLDIRLPQMDGYEIARHVRATRALRHTCIIAVSGLGRPDDVSRSLKSGCNCHLVKPVEPDELRELLSEVETRIRSERAATGMAS